MSLPASIQCIIWMRRTLASDENAAENVLLKTKKIASCTIYRLEKGLSHLAPWKPSFGLYTKSGKIKVNNDDLLKTLLHTSFFFLCSFSLWFWNRQISIFNEVWGDLTFFLIRHYLRTAKRPFLVQPHWGGGIGLNLLTEEAPTTPLPHKSSTMWSGAFWAQEKDLERPEF